MNSDDAVISCSLAAKFVLTVQAGIKTAEAPPGAAQSGGAVVVDHLVVVSVTDGEGLTVVSAQNVSCQKIV